MPDNTNNTSMLMSNQLDLGKIYGINTPEVINNRRNSLVTLGYTLPSLEQIAAYNQMLNEQSAAAQGIGVNSRQNTLAPDNISGVYPMVEAASAAESDAFTPNLEEMYSPITREAAEETPTPANTIGVTYPSQSETGTNEPLINEITDFSNPYPVTQESIQFLNGFIRTQIGRRVSIDFLVGSNQIVTKNGFLVGVATNYILINELDTNDITACDFYNIKFIRFYY